MNSLKSLLMSLLLIAAHQQLAKWSASDKAGGGVSALSTVLDGVLTNATVSHLQTHFGTDVITSNAGASMAAAATGEPGAPAV